VSTWGDGQATWGDPLVDWAGGAIAPPPLVIVTASLPDAVRRQPYQTQIVAYGGTPPYQFAVVSGVLPDGLILDPDTGIISGQPT
jgi:hypothetical protein